MYSGTAWFVDWQWSLGVTVYYSWLIQIYPRGVSMLLFETPFWPASICQLILYSWIHRPSHETCHFRQLWVPWQSVQIRAVIFCWRHHVVLRPSRALHHRDAFLETPLCSSLEWNLANQKSSVRRHEHNICNILESIVFKILKILKLRVQNQSTEPGLLL